MTTVDFDRWSEVVNGPNTYARIAEQLRQRACAIIGWTDGAATHHDVLFTLSPTSHGEIHFGLRSAQCLFVSVVHVGCFGFDLFSQTPHSPAYIEEKLGMGHENATTAALAELIDGVLEQVRL